MNSKKLILVTSTAACLLATPLAMAGGRGHSSGSHGGASFSSPRGSFSAARPSFGRSHSGFAAGRGGAFRQGRPQFTNRSGITNNRFRQTASNRWRGNTANRWHNGNHDWHHGRHHHHHGRSVYFVDYGWPYYGYGWGYPYGYDYDYYPYDYDYGYGDDTGAVYQGTDVSLVLQVQRRLANAGLYRGAIDGVIGSGTRSAIRAYERSHRLPIDGRIDNDLLATMGLS